MYRRHEPRRNRHWQAWNREKNAIEGEREERVCMRVCASCSGTFREHSMHCHSRPTLGPPSRRFETTSPPRYVYRCLNYIGVTFVSIYIYRYSRVYADTPAIFSSYQRTIISALHRCAIARFILFRG